MFFVACGTGACEHAQPQHSPESEKCDGGMSQERASHPRTLRRAVQIAPHLVESAHESIRSILARLGANSTTRREAPFTLPWADSDDPGLYGYVHDTFHTLGVPDYDKRGPQPPRLSWQIFEIEISRDETTRSEGQYRQCLDIPPCETCRGHIRRARDRPNPPKGA